MNIRNDMNKSMTLQDAIRLNNNKTNAPKTEEDKLKEACQSFEALFIHKMMQTMRSATMDGELIKKSNGEKIFTDMLDEKFSELAAKGSVNGIADMLMKQLRRENPANVNDVSAELQNNSMKSALMHSNIIVEKKAKV